MIVTHYGGVSNVANNEALASVLDYCIENMNEFGLSAESSSHPVLLMMVNGDDAHLLYVPEEGHPGWQAVGDEEAVGERWFSTREQPEFIEVDRRFVVPFHVARIAAEQFRIRQVMPAICRWESLLEGE